MKIVVSLDFSPSSNEVIAFAEKMATLMSSKLWLIHIAAPEPDPISLGMQPLPDRSSLAERYRYEHRKLQEIAENMRKKGIDTTALLLQGETVETITEESRKLGADMLIMGSHGHGAIYQMLLGSVSEGVIKEAPCPVLLVPLKER
ncbi:MAG: universal stress protein [Pseudomonadales bacterium]|nr:universal stress protein [Pseudomonadales bacterium]